MRVDPSVHPAAALAFSRLAKEYATWRTVDEARRSDAPGWWWGPAFALRDATATLPTADAEAFGLENAATYAEAAELVMAAMETQAARLWPDDFPIKTPHASKDEAASAGPAAQAAAATALPIAGG